MVVDFYEVVVDGFRKNCRANCTLGHLKQSNLLPNVAVFIPYKITLPIIERPIGRDRTVFYLFMKQDSFIYGCFRLTIFRNRNTWNRS